MAKGTCMNQNAGTDFFLVLFPSESWKQWWRRFVLAVLADWSVITKYRGVFDLMDINELSLSVTSTVGCPLSCCASADQLLTSDINPSVVTRTFTVNHVDRSPFEGSSLYQCGMGVDRPRGILNLFMIMSECVCVTKPCGVYLEKAMKVKNINTSK